MMTAEAGVIAVFVDDLTDYAIVILDIHGNILTWNAGARTPDILRRRSSAGATRPLHQGGRRDRQSTTSLKDALQWGRHEATGRLVRKDGSRIEAKIILRPLSGPRQRFAGYGMLAYLVGESGRAVKAVPPAAAVVSLRATAKILVVDDDKLVREQTVAELASLGYAVVSAGSGDEALAVLQRVNDVDLLFTDVVMPGPLAGRALAAKATELRPGLKVLFASGYFEGALVGRGDLETDAQFLTKPYLKKDLAQKVQEVLHSGS